MNAMATNISLATTEGNCSLLTPHVNQITTIMKMKPSRLAILVVLTSCLAAQGQWSSNIVHIDSGLVIRGNDRDLARIEKTYAEIPPVKYTPPPGRWKQLPRTARCLENGPVLRVVMLGDSIVTDTSHSAWDSLTQRRYPACHIEKVTCVRGSTGCWWYKDNNRVKTFVLDHNPDLLIIGGISQRDDTDSIREVIRQVRDGGSAADILLMTGAFGEIDPRDDKQWQEQVDPDGKDYRARLRKLAFETGSAFLDMSAAWGRYIRESEKELGWFKRDRVHANERGEQILGRVLDRFLSPEADSPGARPASGQGATELPRRLLERPVDEQAALERARTRGSAASAVTSEQTLMFMKTDEPKKGKDVVAMRNGVIDRVAAALL